MLVGRECGGAVLWVVVGTIAQFRGVGGAGGRGGVLHGVVEDDPCVWKGGNVSVESFVDEWYKKRTMGTGIDCLQITPGNQPRRVKIQVMER